MPTLGDLSKGIGNKNHLLYLLHYFSEVGQEIVNNHTQSQRDTMASLGRKGSELEAWLQGFVVGGDQGYLGIFKMDSKAQAHCRQRCALALYDICELCAEKCIGWK